jgi:hypothetical protein
MLFSAFIGSRPDTLLEIDNSPLKSSRENSINDLLDNTLADNNDGDILINDVFKLNAQNIKRPGTVYYEDIDFFFLRNPNNPERDILIIKINFKNLKGRAEGADK